MFGLLDFGVLIVQQELVRQLAEKKSAEQDALRREQCDEYERRKYAGDVIDVEARVIEDVPLLQNSAATPDEVEK